MSPKTRIEFDRPACLKVKKDAVVARIKAENEELVLDVRGSPLFARSGHDMAVYTSVLTLLEAGGLIPDALVERAYAHARAAAEVYLVREAEPKQEELRLELLRAPGPALAALLERDGLVSRYSHPGGPIVFYGRGVLAEYRPYVQAPESLAPSAFAAAVAHRQADDADSAAMIAAAGGILLPEPTPVFPEPGGGEAPLSGGAARGPAFRIDKLLKSPLLADTLMTVVVDRGPVYKAEVIERLKLAAGQVRLQAKTETAIGNALIGLTLEKRLAVDKAGRYRTADAAAGADLDATGGAVPPDNSDDRVQG